jgi:hypothetical protein
MGAYFLGKQTDRSFYFPLFFWFVIFWGLYLLGELFPFYERGPEKVALK